jgi:hypothetical protein
MRIKNRLWNPEHEQKTSVKQHKKPPQDDICLACPNHKDNHCKGLCPPLQWINGRSETKELIPDNPISRGIEQRDYNQALYEMIVDKQATDIDRLDTIRSINDYRLRAIAACILSYIPQQQIAKFAHISQGRISKLYHAIKR